MKRIFTVFLAFILLIFASACANEETVENSSSEQSSILIESNTSKATTTSKASSKPTETSSKPKAASKETTTTSKSEPETSSEKVSTSSKKVYYADAIEIDSNLMIPYSSNSTGGGTSKYMYAEEMCNDPELLAELEAVNETYNESGLEIYLEGEENKITFVYKFLQQIDAQTIKPQLEEAIKTQKDTFNYQVEQLQTQVMTKVILGIKYVNADGTTICEAEFPQ